MHRPLNKKIRILWLPIAALIAMSSWSVYTAYAGPVTGGSNNPPYIEAGVYQGVVAVIPGGAGDSVMEIGNLGQDISTTGDLYFRPQSVAGTNAGVRFTKNNVSGKTDLHVYSRLCLAGGGCVDTWPTPGGTSYWTQNSTWLEPSTVGRGVYTASSGSAWSPNLEIFGDHPDAALYISKQGAGTALNVDSDVTVMGDLDVSGQLTMLNCPPGEVCTWPDGYSVATVWHPGNDGRGSGLDASKLDGVPFHVVRDPYGPTPVTCGGSGSWCVCGEFEAMSGWQCLTFQ